MTDSKTEAWRADIENRLTKARTDAGVSLDQVIWLRRAEQGRVKKLSLQVVVRAAEEFNLHPMWILFGTHVGRTWPRLSWWAQDDAMDRVRMALRDARGTRSLRHIQNAAGIHQATLSKVESGKYETIDLIRFDQVLRVCGTTWRDLFHKLSHGS